MKPIFKNTTKYTEEVYLKFCDIHTKTTLFSSSASAILICCIFILFIAVQIKMHNYGIVFLFCIVLTIYILWKLLYPFYLAKKEINSDKIIKQKIFSFRFYEKHFSVKNKTSISQNSYKDLEKILITTEYSYLYISKRYAYVLDNNCFSIGTIDDFKTFIHKKTNFKCKFKDINSK